MRFEELAIGSHVVGLGGAQAVEVVAVIPFSSDAINVIYRIDGGVAERIAYRGEEASFSLDAPGQAYAFDAEGSELKLAIEAQRIRLAHLFDPYLAVSSSQIEAFPHQITAV